VIDLLPVFEATYRGDGSRFEFPSNTHWNGYAHGLLAEAAKVAVGVPAPANAKR